MKYTIHLDEDDVLALDEYLTKKLGYLGHDGAPDMVMQSLCKVIAEAAEEIRINREIANNVSKPATND